MEAQGQYGAHNRQAAPEDAVQRSSAGSGRSTASRSRQTPAQQLSTIEKSVTHLLVATKQLLETLTMWSTGRATEGEVSDVYVRLGYEFNIACRAFNAIGVDTADLGPVPDMLRTILEETLSQEASQQSLEKYLPRIRDIIINLLHGLKKKQQRLRQKSGKDGEPSRQPRHASSASTMSVESSAPSQEDHFPSRQASSRSFAQRQPNEDLTSPVDYLPPRTTSAPTRTSPTRGSTLSPQASYNGSLRDPQEAPTGFETSAPYPENPMQNAPVMPPYPENDPVPIIHTHEPPPSSSPEPTYQPAKADDALMKLQRGGELERRASRRFSAYQIQKSLGTSINGISAIPPAQNSPVPNRGRDVRESMTAVRSRSNILHSRGPSRTTRPGIEPSPNRENDVRRISEEPSIQQEPVVVIPDQPSQSSDQVDSPNIKTPEDKLGAPPFSSSDPFSATVSGPLDEPFVPSATTVPDDELPVVSTRLSRNRANRQGRDYSYPPAQFIPESPPQTGKELTLFLQYKSKIKKFVLSDGGDITIPRLQLAFIEKFAWNTHNNGVDLPEIYIQDPVSGVRHELEDLSDIRDRSVLVLNVEQLDEVKRHFDEGIGGLRRIVEGIRTSVVEQQTSLQLVSERQQETAKELASIAAAPPVAPPTPVLMQQGSSRGALSQIKEVQTLRRELAVVRQTYTSFATDIAASMSTIRAKAGTIKKAVRDSKIPEMDTNTGRAYVDAGKKTLNADSERIVNRVDDLQDLVEDLRKDVVTRGVRPLPRQLESVSKDISIATADLKKLQEFLKREKPTWTKIWEKELQVVCDDRDLLTMQEELAADLEDDLEKAAATFALVEQATKQQNLQNQTNGDAGVPGTFPGGTRIPSRTLNFDQGADPQKAKDSVLGEVRALSVNHESRLEAIERAEKARRRELESRAGGEFKRELGKFVEEGRLHKSGGVEEVERMRKIREEKTRREVWERQQARLLAQAEKEREAAAAAAAAAAAGEGEPAASGDGQTSNVAQEQESTAEPTENLDVPHQPADGAGESSSPEPDFVEAKEVSSPPPAEGS